MSYERVMEQKNNIETSPPSPISSGPWWLILWSKVNSEWPHVRSNPVSFFTVSALFSGLLLCFAWYFGLLVPGVIATSLKAQNEILRTQIDTYEKQLKGGVSNQNQESMEGFWKPLTNEEQAAVVRQLNSTTEFEVVISCDQISCRALTLSLLETFKSANWKHVRASIGGMDQIGMEGISVSPVDSNALKLKELIEVSSGLKVSLFGEKRQPNSDPAVLISIGQKPF